MQTNHFLKAGILTLVLVITALASWEFHLRNKGLSVDFDDGESLWSDKRAMVYEPITSSTVFIGSSRIKFDLDIATWQNTTGDHVIQLANVGSSPLPVLDDLANDKNFKGRLIVDVTEGIFFSSNPFFFKTPTENIAFYKKRTPAQRFSFLVNRPLESRLVFLDKGNFSLSAMLDELHIPNRPGVFAMPIFPVDFNRVTFDRQCYMTPRFVADTKLQNQVKDIWTFFAKANADPPADGDKLQAILTSIKTSVDKIKARGGQVLFVRTPSSGAALQGENMGFPRAKYWDRLLEFTNCPGIHFTDYPAIAHFTCPEWSHLTPGDAKIFTKNLIKILQQDKGWSFVKSQTTP